jgi:hypothetical protein
LYEIVTGNIDKWILIEGHTYLIPKYKNKNNITYDWEYDSYNNILKYTGTGCDKNKKIRMEVISIEAEIDKNKYNLDSFLEKIEIYGPSPSKVNLNVLFLCWSIFTNNAFNINNEIVLNYITIMGDENRIRLFDRNCVSNQLDN